MRSFIVFVSMLFVATTSFSSVINQIGTYGNWASSWTSLGGYDADDGLAETADYVGDVSSPGLYYANNGSYVMFRMRVDADTFTTSSDSYLLLFDIAGYGVTGIDYAFIWDSKSTQVANHGCEMGIAGVNGPTWGVTECVDIDGTPSAKTTLDINGAGRTTDGYIRTTDGLVTTNFGDTTFIDIAVSWNYLQTNTQMRSNQTWNVAQVSIVNKTDHNKFTEFGNSINSTDNISVGWSAPIPEPATILLIGVTGVLNLFIRRRFIR